MFGNRFWFYCASREIPPHHCSSLPFAFINSLFSSATTLCNVLSINSNAGEMIAEGVLAMEYGASSEDVGRTCHAHPVRDNLDLQTDRNELPWVLSVIHRSSFAHVSYTDAEWSCEGGSACHIRQTNSFLKRIKSNEHETHRKHTNATHQPVCQSLSIWVVWEIDSSC